MKIHGSIFQNEPFTAIAFANVTEVETGRQTQTADDGSFDLEVQGYSSNLRISHASFDYDTVSVGDFVNVYKGLYELYPKTLDDVIVPNRPKAEFPWLALAGAAVGSFILARMVSGGKKTQPKKVTI